MKRQLALGKDKFTFYLTSLMLVIPTSSNIDSWIYADYSTNGWHLVGGISQPCGTGFPEDALSDLYVPSSCNPVMTEACDLHAIRYILAAGSVAEAGWGSGFIPSVLSSLLL